MSIIVMFFPGVVMSRVTTVRLRIIFHNIDITTLVLMNNDQYRPDLNDDDNDVVAQLLHKLRLMRSSLSVRVHDFLQVDLI